MMILRLAFRNLLRHKWRSALTAGGIALAVGLLIFLSSWMGGMLKTMVASATETSMGHVLVEAATGGDVRTLHDVLPYDRGALGEVDRQSALRALLPRLEFFGLAGDEERAQVVRLVGVDPERERIASSLAKSLRAGVWLSSRPRDEAAALEAVLGAALARQLHAQVGDELVFFTQAADGSLGNDVLRVVGVVTTGHSVIDRATVFVDLAAAQELVALEGYVHSYLLLAEDVRAVDDLVLGVAPWLESLAGPGQVYREASSTASEGVLVRTWQEVAPALAEMVALSQGVAWLFYVILFVLAGFGVVNTQRMSVLERRREFGVLLAVGTRPATLAALVVAETVMLALAGAALGLAFGAGLVLLVGQVGLDLSVFTAYEGDITILGLQLSEPMYTSLADADLWTPVAMMGGLALLFALPAALRAARMDAVRAISGRT